MADEVKVQIVFQINDFRDALYVSLADYESLKASGELARMKQKRYDDWKKAVDDAAKQPVAPVVPPTPEDRRAKLLNTRTKAQELLTSIEIAIAQEP